MWRMAQLNVAALFKNMYCSVNHLAIDIGYLFFNLEWKLPVTFWKQIIFLM